MRKQTLEAKNYSKDLKVKSMKLKQEKWMAERSIAQEPTPISSKSATISRSTRARGTTGQNKPLNHDRNENTMRWTGNSNTPNSDEFVVRKLPNYKSKPGRKMNEEKNKNYQQYNISEALKGRARSSGEDYSRLTKQNIQSSLASSEGYDIDDISSELETVMSDLDHQSLCEWEGASRRYSPSNYGSVTPNSIGFNQVNTDSYYPNHFCPCCKEVMNQSSCSPMLVIPCGHSVCNKCTSRKSLCPQCNSKMTSFVENVGLKEVISSHKETLDKERTKKENDLIHKYKQEYDSFKVRSTVLQDEAQTIVTEMKSITDELLTTRSNMDNIQQDAKLTKEKIKQLKEKLQEYETKYVEQNSMSQKLDLDYKRKQESLSMVEDTLSKIKSGKDKIQLIVSEINPNIDINTWQGK